MAASYSYADIYPISADVTTVATQLAQRQSDAGTTNGGITASGGAATVPQLGVDASGIGLAYLKAMADTMLCSVGYLGHDDQYTAGAASTSSSTFSDVGDGTTTGFQHYSFSFPLAKTYLVRVDLACYVTAVASQAEFQLVLDSTVIASNPSMTLNVVTLASPQVMSFSVPVAVASSGSHTLKLQWKVVGGGTLQVGTKEWRAYTITG